MRPAARPGMDRNPGRLIDDQDKPVAIQHPFGELVGAEVTGVRTPSWKPLPVLRSCMRPPAPVAGEGWGGGISLRHAGNIVPQGRPRKPPGAPSTALPALSVVAAREDGNDCCG